MSRGYSFAIVEGGLGRDPEIKSTTSGTRVANFSLGYERGFGDKARTVWVNIVAFKELADLTEKYLKKGKPVRVFGEIDVRSWDDKETGKKRYVTEIVANKIDFVDSGSRSSESGERPTRQERATPTRTQQTPATRTPPVTHANDDPFRSESEIQDDDIPF